MTDIFLETLMFDFASIDFAIKNVECGEGWHELIYETFQQIDNIGLPFLREYNKVCMNVLQIKQKNGKLRIDYTTSYNIDILSDFKKELQDILKSAYIKSGEICETCGNPGTLTSYRGNISASCGQHKLGIDDYDYSDTKSQWKKFTKGSLLTIKKERMIK